MKKKYLIGFFAACLLGTGMLPAQTVVSDTLKFVFKLHGQTRRYQVVFCEQDGGLRMNWGIERNMHWQSGSYTMTPKALESGSQLCFLQPDDGNHLQLSDAETVYVVPQKALKQLKETGSMDFNYTVYDRRKMRRRRMADVRCSTWLTATKAEKCGYGTIRRCPSSGGWQTIRWK